MGIAEGQRGPENGISCYCVGLCRMLGSERPVPRNQFESLCRPNSSITNKETGSSYDLLSAQKLFDVEFQQQLGHQERGGSKVSN
eukprot:scaffold7969_cov56-Attheya_sp.AAC.7